MSSKSTVGLMDCIRAIRDIATYALTFESCPQKNEQEYSSTVSVIDIITAIKREIQKNKERIQREGINDEAMVSTLNSVNRGLYAAMAIIGQLIQDKS
jgi:hypothetical protein